MDGNLSTVTGDGVTIRKGSRGQVLGYIGSDGKAYDSLEAATRASKLYNAANEATIKDLKSSGSKADSYANDFLKKWGDITDASLSTLQNALSGVNSSTGDPYFDSIIGDIKKQASSIESDYGKTVKDIDAMKIGASKEYDSILSKYDDLAQSIKTQYGEGSAEFDNAINNIESVLQNIIGETGKYDEQTEQALATALQQIETKQGLANQLISESAPDFKGVSGRAAADTGTQYELARGETAREAMSYGIDPTSGKFGALQKKSVLGEARAKVEAMNRARNIEKLRSMDATLKAASIINPMEAGSLATSLMAQKGSLLGLQASTANALTAAAGAKGAYGLNAMDVLAGNLQGQAALTSTKQSTLSDYERMKLAAGSDKTSAQSNLLGLQTDIGKAKTAGSVAKTGAITDIANSISDIGNQYGSLGSSMLGLQIASDTSREDLKNLLNQGQG
jgi:hypothetical protein